MVLGRTIVLPENMVYLLIPLLYVFRSYQIEFRAQYISSMYLSLVKNIYSLIHVPRYESYSEFDADMETTLETFYTTIEEIDPDLFEHLNTQVLTDEAHDAD